MLRSFSRYLVVSLVLSGLFGGAGMGVPSSARAQDEEPGSLKEWITKNPVLQEMLGKAKEAALKQAQKGFTVYATEARLELSFFGTGPTDAIVWNGAYTKDRFRFAAVLPNDVGGYLNDLNVKNAVVVLADDDNEPELANIPDAVAEPLRRILGEDAKSVPLKSGINLFAAIDLGSSGSLGEFRRQYGIAEDAAVMSGSVDGYFALSLAGLRPPKTRIEIDRLNLSLTLSGIKLKGASVTSGPVRLTFAYDKQKGSLKGSGETTVKITGGRGEQTVHAKIALDRAPKDGMNFIAVTGDVEDSAGFIPEHDSLEVNRLALFLGLVNRKGRPERELAMVGEGTLNDKPIQLRIDLAPDSRGRKRERQVVTLSGTITASDLAGGGSAAEGLDDIALTEVKLTKGYISGTFHSGAGGRTAQVVAYRPTGKSAPNLAIGHKELTFSSFVPALKNTPLDGLNVDNFVFFLVPAANFAAGVEVKDVPAPVVDMLGGENSPLFPFDLQHRGTLVSILRKPDIGPIRDLLELLRVAARGMKMVGVTDDMAAFAKAFAKAGVKEVKKLLIRNLHISVDLPPISPDYLPSHVSFGKGRLTIDGNPDGETIETAVRTTLRISVTDKKKLAFKGRFVSEKDRLVFKTTTAVKWDKPFNLDWLEIRDVVLAATISKNTEKVATELKGKTKISKRVYETTIAVVKDPQGANDVRVRLKGRTPLADIPGLKDLPGAGDLSFEDLEIGRHGLAGAMDFKGTTVRAAAFRVAGAANLALKFEDLSLSKLIPPLKQTLFSDINLPYATLVLSTRDWKTKVAKLSPATRAVFEGSIADKKSDIAVGKGVNLVAVVDPSKLGGNLTKPLQTIGIGQKATIGIAGQVGGIFGDAPRLGLVGNLPYLPAPTIPGLKGMKIAGGQASFLLLYESGGSVAGKKQAAIGFEVLSDIDIGGDDLRFTLRFLVAEDKKGASFSVGGKMEGDWKNPAGLKGITLSDVQLSMAPKIGAESSGTVTVTFGGTTKIGKRKTVVYSSADLAPGAGGMPTKMAFVGATDEMGLQAMVDMANLFVRAGGGAKLDVSALPIARVKLEDVALALVSPGASSDAELMRKLGLQIDGVGMAVRGKLMFDKTLLSEVDGYASDRGLRLFGDVLVKAIGPLKIKKAVVDAKVTLGALPYFKLAGDMDFIGFKRKLEVELSTRKIAIAFEDEFAGFGATRFEAATKGKNLAHIDDFTVAGSITNNLAREFLKYVKQGAEKGLDKIGDEYRNADNDLNDALENFGKKEKDLKKAKKAAKKRIARAKKPIKKAQKKVGKISDDIKTEKKKIRKLEDWLDDNSWDLALADKTADKTVKLVGHKIALGSLYAARGVARGVLKAAKKAVSIVPVELDPEVLALVIEVEGARFGIAVAKGVLKGLEEANKGVQTTMTTLATFGSKALELFDIRRAGFVASAKRIAKGTGGIDLNLVLVVNGEEKDGGFTFYPTKPDKNVKELISLARGAGRKIASQKRAKSVKKHRETAEAAASTKMPILTYVPRLNRAGFVKSAAKVYQFRNEKYIRYNFAKGKTDRGYPKPTTGWQGFSGQMDAAVRHPFKKKVYFFKDDKYYRFDTKKNRMDAGFPKKIAGQWGGLWAAMKTLGATSIDSAFRYYAPGNSRNNKIYFFVGEHYFRYDFKKKKMGAGYPRRIGDGWPGLWGDYIDMAFQRPVNPKEYIADQKGKKTSLHKIYFFSGDEYIRYDMKKGRADNNYPKKIGDAWSMLPEFTEREMGEEEIADAEAKQVDAVLRLGKKYYFFKGGNVVKFDRKAKKIEAGFPKKIGEVFTGVPGDLDAAVKHLKKDSIVYFFKGGEYWRHDVKKKKTDKARKIQAGFGKLWSEVKKASGERIDAAARRATKGRLYFFVGDTYIRYDGPNKMDAELIVGENKGGWPGVWAEDITSASENGGKKQFFFKFDEYVRYTLGTKRADAGYPKKSEKVWKLPGKGFLTP